MPIVLGIDASTQSMSGVVFDGSEHKIILKESISFQDDLSSAYPNTNGFIKGENEGEVYTSPIMWVDALEKLLVKISNKFSLEKIEAIGGAAQQHATVYLNSEFEERLQTLNIEQSISSQISSCFSRKLSPIWMDSSTESQCKEMTLALGSDEIAWKKCGSIITKRFSGPQIKRFRQFDPDGYTDTSRIHLASSFLATILLGKEAPIDRGDGAGMNLLNLATNDWDSDLIQAIDPDLINKLPVIATETSSLGSISPYFCAKYGFSSETKISLFTGDNPASLVGLVGKKQNVSIISLGTSDTIFSSFKEIPKTSSLQGHIFGNPLGGFMGLQCFANGSLAREKVKDRLSVEWSFFEKALHKIGNPSNIILPFFEPEISPPLTLGSPVLVGEDSFRSWENKEEIIRSTIVAQFVNLKHQSEWMETADHEIIITGGASQNDGIANMIAAVFNKQVKRIQVPDSASIGAAKLALLAIDPNYDIDSQGSSTGMESFHPSLEMVKYCQAYHTLFQGLMNKQSLF